MQLTNIVFLFTDPFFQQVFNFDDIYKFGIVSKEIPIHRVIESRVIELYKSN